MVKITQIMRVITIRVEMQKDAIGIIRLPDESLVKLRVFIKRDAFTVEALTNIGPSVDVLCGLILIDVKS